MITLSTNDKLRIQKCVIFGNLNGKRRIKKIINVALKKLVRRLIRVIGIKAIFLRRRSCIPTFHIILA